MFTKEQLILIRELAYAEVLVIELVRPTDRTERNGQKWALLNEIYEQAGDALDTEEE